MNNMTPRKPRTANASKGAFGTLPFSYLVVIAICGCVIAAGFLLAARQHFVSMDLGMKNSKLRKQLEDLETEQRRLTLAREVALAPKEITRTARDLGFVDTLEATLAVPVPVPVTNGSPASGKTAALVKTAAPPIGAAVTRTAYQRPAATVGASATPKKPESRKPSRNG